MSIELFDNEVERELDIIDDAELLEAELGLDIDEASDILDDIAFLNDMGLDPTDLFEV